MIFKSVFCQNIFISLHYFIISMKVLKKGNYSRNKKIAKKTSIVAFYDLSPHSDNYVVQFEWDAKNHTYVLESSKYYLDDFEGSQEYHPDIIFHPFRLTKYLMRQIMLLDVEKDTDYDEDVIEESINKSIKIIHSPNTEVYLKKWIIQFPRISPYIQKKLTTEPKKQNETDEFFKYLKEYLANDENYSERKPHHYSFHYTIKIRHFIDFMMDKLNIVVEKQFATLFTNIADGDNRFNVVAKRIGLPYYRDGFYYDPEKRIYVIETTF